MCQLLMNNELKKITIIALSHVNISKKIQNENRCDCIIKHTDVFLLPIRTAQIPKPVKNIEAFVRYDAPVHLCIYMHRCCFTAYEHRTNTYINYKLWCVCVILCTRAFFFLYASVHLDDQ